MSDIAKLFGGEGDDLMILTVSVPNEEMEISGSITKEDLDKPISDIFKVIFEAVEASNKLKKLGVNVAVTKKSSPIAEFINRTSAAPANVVNNNQEDQGERPARNPFRQNQSGVRSIVVQKGGKQVDANTGANSPESSDDGFEDDQQLSGENDYQESLVDDTPYSQVDEIFEGDDDEPVQQPTRNAQPRRRTNSTAPIAPVQPNEKLDFKRVQASMRNRSHVELADVNAVLKIPTKIPAKIRDDMGTTTIKVRPQTNDVIKELDRRRGVEDAR